MKHKNNRRKALWITLFIILLGISGLGLAASGNMQNPLAVLAGGSGQGGEHSGPPAGATHQNNTQPPQGNFQRGEGGDQNSINWSGIGGVLYNVWFLFAMAAVVIVIQTVGGGIIQTVKQRVPRASSP